ncbi:MAG: 5-(carboxyamino)imidazole ribonucleotide synthase [Defluviitaleaceae bacterium]|nr:5-(carboxyamino)imidazole ribonucleotide synthase [Defluviitaleaceae bacterium]
MKPLLATKIGIIGGGQLGKMMILEAKKMGMVVNVLDPDPTCPSSSICDNFILGGLKDADAIKKLADISDVVTYEIEHINVDALFEIEKAGKPVYPTPHSLKVIQNKLTQKATLKEKGAPVPDFLAVNDKADLLKAGEEFGYPMMVKACLGGYDGKGNFLIKSASQVDECFTFLQAGPENPLMVERFVDFTMEVSVLATRGINGEIAIYPVAENAHKNEVLDETLVPANISEATSQKAIAVAQSVMEIFEGVGMFCVEMFVTTSGDILINEIAPRPHNSGHYTIEACISSQFENHVRAVVGLPLGSTRLLSPVVMKNILGAEGEDGPVVIKAACDVLKIPGASLHIYGKANTVPKRKMGHITVIADTVADALGKARKAHSDFKIFGGEDSEQYKLYKQSCNNNG